MSFIVRGPGRVVSIDHEEVPRDTLRVGEVAWQDDCVDRLAPGDRVVQGMCAVRRLPPE